jgi:hypothetical protein
MEMGQQKRPVETAAKIAMRLSPAHGIGADYCRNGSGNGRNFLPENAPRADPNR